MNLDVNCVIRFELPKQLFTQSNLLCIEGAYVRYAQRNYRLNHDLSAIVINTAFSWLDMWPKNDELVQCYAVLFTDFLIPRRLRGSRDYEIDWRIDNFNIKLKETNVPLHLHLGIRTPMMPSATMISEVWGKRGRNPMPLKKEWSLAFKAEVYRWDYIFNVLQDPIILN
ncbi:hypothetical protein [Landjia virus]|uniref:Uncharacterized protein n=1 Tax=Landjia virus TaxID=1272947 RepID=A0A0D3R185_9RHAB|nr:hypothetical protein [Landjia virus]AJR28484.1 hypothetical protein [Landjia virus]